VNTGLHNQIDSTGAGIVGPSTGPILELSTEVDVHTIREDFKTSGEVPGRTFAWELPVFGQNEGTGYFANLVGTETFTPVVRRHSRGGMKPSLTRSVAPRC